MRPPVSVFKNVLNPSVGCPSKFSFGTRIFSKNNCRVSLARQPIFFSLGPIFNPGLSVSTMSAPIPLFSPFSIIFVVNVSNPARLEFVINIFPPLTTYSSPFNSAVVLVEPASLPADGSVNPKAPIISPVASLGRYFCFCSSVPAMAMGNDPKDV